MPLLCLPLCFSRVRTACISFSFSCALPGPVFHKIFFIRVLSDISSSRPSGVCMCVSLSLSVCQTVVVPYLLPYRYASVFRNSSVSIRTPLSTGALLSPTTVTVLQECTEQRRALFLRALIRFLLSYCLTLRAKSHYFSYFCSFTLSVGRRTYALFIALRVCLSLLAFSFFYDIG